MAGLTLTALQRLLPCGRAWRPIGQTAEVIEALATYLETPHEFLRAVLDESIPGTATLTLDAWLETLNISVAAGASVGTKRAAIIAELTSLGGQSLDYINDRIQISFPNVYIEEIPGDPFTYRVAGYYPFSSDFARLWAMLKRLAPLHLTPLLAARSQNDGDVARCGIGRTGIEITGRTVTAYTDTQGELGVCGQGRTGLERTGYEG
jgi:hypothetical protein